jgi:hypothetical protein
VTKEQGFNAGVKRLSDRVIIRIKGYFGQGNPALNFPYLFLSAAGYPATPVFADDAVHFAPVFAQALFRPIQVVGSFPGHVCTPVIAHYHCSFTLLFSVSPSVCRDIVIINLLFLQ